MGGSHLLCLIPADARASWASHLPPVGTMRVVLVWECGCICCGSGGITFTAIRQCAQC
jgi:hypothetical protein